MLSEFDEIVDIFKSLPGIGSRGAVRIAFHLLKQPKERLDYISQKLLHFYESIEYCNLCAALKSTNDSCIYCNTELRTNTQICIIEEPSDIFVIEKTGEFKGLYHVLMGVLSPLDGIGPKDLRLAQLKKRIEDNQNIEEVIVATNPTIEGNATANYIATFLAEFKYLKITRIASGLATGSQLDFADSQIVKQSIKHRINIIT